MSLPRSLVAGLVALIVVAGFAGAGAGPIAPTVAEPTEGSNASDPGANATTNATVRVERIDGAALPPGNDAWPSVTSGVRTAGVERRIAVVVEATAPEAVNGSRLRAMGATVGERRGELVRATVRPGRVAAYRALPWVERVRAPNEARRLVTSEGVADIGADEVHADGETGAGVAVGIIDTGFDPDAPEIEDSVAATRSFSSSGIGGSTHAAANHGTAVAELVEDVAPGVELYLVNVDDSIDFLDAVDWLESKDVDAITTSLGFYGQPYDGTGNVARRADRAAENGTVWVNAAGNSARDHWEGRFTDADGDELHEFAGDDEGNTLNGGEPIEADQSLTVSLQWDEWPTAEHDVDLLLMRQTGNGLKQVAESKRTYGHGLAAERLSTTIRTEAVYSLAIRADSGVAGTAVETFVLDRRLNGRSETEYLNVSSSIIAPATGDRVIAVGAYDVGDGSLAPYSARGPTDDGDRAIGVVGPVNVETATYDHPFAGTSAAAPHAAGVAALARGSQSSPDAAAVAASLLDGADAAGSTGADPAWGHGRLNATGAVAALETASGDGNESDSLPPVGDSTSSPTDPDGDGRYEDVDGSGEFSIVDVTVLFDGLDDPAVQDHVDAYDFDGSGTANVVDVSALLGEL